MTQKNDTQPTMGDLMNHVADIKTIAPGDLVNGIVVYVAKNEVLLDIDSIGLGVVRGKELYNEEYLSRIKVGEAMEAMVIDLDNELGYLELSFRAIGRDKIWAEIKTAHEEHQTVDAKIKDANRGGFLIKVHGIDGFLPASLLSPTHAIKQIGIEEKSLVNQMKKYVGQTFKVKILSINPESDSLIASEKAVSDELSREKLSKYKIGDVVEGTVVGMVDFGIFVRFDEDLEGLVHISEIAWKKIEDPKNEFKIGEKVKVKITEIDKDNRINLSIKALLSNPWHDFAKHTKPGDKFVGKVVKIISYGVIVTNADDIQGLCHISQLSTQELDSPAKIHEIVSLGQEKEFTVLSVDQDEKLHLTLLDYDTALKIQHEQNLKMKERKEEGFDTSENSEENTDN